MRGVELQTARVKECQERRDYFLDFLVKAITTLFV